jgi:hypothetical protein
MHRDESCGSDLFARQAPLHFWQNEAFLIWQAARLMLLLSLLFTLDPYG